MPWLPCVPLRHQVVAGSSAAGTVGLGAWSAGSAADGNAWQRTGIAAITRLPTMAGRRGGPRARDTTPHRAGVGRQRELLQQQSQQDDHGNPSMMAAAMHGDR